MPTRREKYVAYSDQVLDSYIRLHASYSLARPLLFDARVKTQFKTQDERHGASIIATTMLRGFVLEVAKLAFDADRRSPSLATLRHALRDSHLLAELRDGFARLDLHYGTSDPDIVRMLEKAALADKADRLAQFDSLVQDFCSGWEALQESPTFIAFKALRDKIIAHTEVQHVDGQYRIADVASLSIRDNEFDEVMVTLKTLVDQANLVFRASSFAFEHLDAIMTKAADAFWSIAVVSRPVA